MILSISSEFSFYLLNFQVLPDDMLDFLDAPVPYVVSILIHAHKLSDNGFFFWTS